MCEAAVTCFQSTTDADKELLFRNALQHDIESVSFWLMFPCLYLSCTEPHSHHGEDHGHSHKSEESHDHGHSHGMQLLPYFL